MSALVLANGVQNDIQFMQTQSSVHGIWRPKVIYINWNAIAVIAELLGSFAALAKLVYRALQL